MPVLEAMASGIPVISSGTTALSEICADAALLVCPGNVDEISDAVRELNQKVAVRKDLIARGLDRVTEFNWEKSADIVRRFYLRHFGL
jgi:glycosyltransferase involved in cell wall biosynthesis